MQTTDSAISYLRDESIVNWKVYSADGKKTMYTHIQAQREEDPYQRLKQCLNNLMPGTKVIIKGSNEEEVKGKWKGGVELLSMIPYADQKTPVSIGQNYSSELMNAKLDNMQQKYDHDIKIRELNDENKKETSGWADLMNDPEKLASFVGTMGAALSGIASQVLGRAQQNHNSQLAGNKPQETQLILETDKQADKQTKEQKEKKENDIFQAQLALLEKNMQEVINVVPIENVNKLLKAIIKEPNLVEKALRFIG